jgi:uncharacterized membrane protein
VFFHWVVSFYPHSALGTLLSAAPLLIVIAWFVGRESVAGLLTLVLSLAVAGIIVQQRQLNATFLYPIPHLAINLFMLWLFGHTLRRGREALITRVARQVHGSLPDDVAAYTRRVTWAWCIFFTCVVTVSALLFLVAPLPVWSLFANLLNLPLVASMFLSEYAWRLWRHPQFARASLPEIVQAFRKLSDSLPASSR